MTKTVSFLILAENGAEKEEVKAKTLIGAKREASKWMTYGAGNVYLAEPNGRMWYRRFWENGKAFGWRRWESIH